MNRYFIIILSIFIFVFSVNAQTAQENELKRIEVKRSQAIKDKDLKTLENIYAEDFRGVAANGQVVNRKQLMEVFKNTGSQLLFATDEIEVRIYGSTAVVTGRLTAQISTGETVNEARFIHVYLKRKGRWQFVQGQSTNVAKAAV